MNATKILNALQTALFFTIAICDVICIWLFGDWQAEVAAAKQTLGANAIAPTTEPAPAPETITPTEIEQKLEQIKDPWDLPAEPKADTTPQPQQPKPRHLMLCLPAAKEPEPLPVKKPRTAKTKTAKTRTTAKTKTRTKKAA